MSARLLDLCLLAFPREVRERDGDLLRDLALDFAASHGVLREAAGLVRAGLTERVRRRGLARRRLVALAVMAGIALPLSVAGVAAAGAMSYEVERITCAATCRAAESEADALAGDGWDCETLRAEQGAGWRCTRD